MIYATIIAITLLVVLIVRNIAPPEKKVEELLGLKGDLSEKRFLREVSVLLGSPIVGGNSIECLNNGQEIFPAMLKSIRSAEKTITFETFIYWSGEVGKEFSRAFAERAEAGVEVKVLIDWLGSKILGSEEEKIIREAGVDLQIYRPLNWFHLSRANHRTHRKILVVDGRIAFTGGVGIADQWKGDVKGDAAQREWRDIHFQLQGPVVAHLQSVFINNWIKTTGVCLRGEGYFPALSKAGEMELQCFHSSPTEGAESVRLMFLYLIESARETLEISAAYFVPDCLMRKALLMASGRGVKVRVILPSSNNDHEAVLHSSRELWGGLLEAGVEIYRFQPSMYHCKAVLADRKILSIGSANFDCRSFHLNDEMNVNVFDAKFAAELGEIFEKDLEDCEPMTLQEWHDRPWTTKLLDWWYGRFRSQL